MGGDLKKIRTVGQYMVEVRSAWWRAHSRCIRSAARRSRARGCDRSDATHPLRRALSVFLRDDNSPPQVWKAAGMDMTNVEFLWASDEINAHANDYWLRVMDIARSFNVPRIVRCCTIMGRKEEDDLSAAQIFYPCMQCADVFFLKADICQLGMDQRKVRVVAVHAAERAAAGGRVLGGCGQA